VLWHAVDLRRVHVLGGCPVDDVAALVPGRYCVAARVSLGGGMVASVSRSLRRRSAAAVWQVVALSLGLTS
jgi:hypothetical protein